MRTLASITSLSWIPSEAVRGLHRMPFDRGVAHYDEPPPDRLEGSSHLDELRRADRFRFANRLSVWIDVVDGRIADHGVTGGGQIGSTTMGVGSRSRTFAAVPYPDLTVAAEQGATWVRYRVTAGGRTGVPMPRRVSRPPFVQLAAPTAWTTLELTLHADGHHEGRLVDASAFPRHWLYDDDGVLVAKSGTVDFRQWMRHAFGGATPWAAAADVSTLGAVVTGEVESALERDLSTRIMGSPVDVRRITPGTVLLHQGDPGDALFLLLDGVVEVAVDGVVLAELGPGAVLGERAAGSDGRRTATVTARTACSLAETSVHAALSSADVVALADEHRREEELR